MPPAEPSTSFSFVDFVLSPSGATIAWLAALASLLLALVPLALGLANRKRDAAVKEILDKFNASEQIAVEAKTLEEKKQSAQEEFRDIEKQISAFQSDIKVQLPKEARKAFYSTSIPLIDEQLQELIDRRARMVDGLLKLGEPTLGLKATEEILAEEIRTRLLARKELERNQTFLSIATAMSASALYVTPFPFNRALAGLFAIIIAFIVANLIANSINVYPEAKLSKVLMSRYFRLGVIGFAALLLLGVVTVTALILLNTYSYR